MWRVQEALKNNYKMIKFVPFNPTDKFTCATIREEGTGKVYRLMKGSPQVGHHNPAYRSCTHV